LYTCTYADYLRHRLERLVYLVSVALLALWVIFQKYFCSNAAFTVSKMVANNYEHTRALLKNKYRARFINYR